MVITMERKNINDIKLCGGVLFGKQVWITEDRIDRRDLPYGNMYVYELRHDDNGDWTTPVEICNNVLVNFCMTIIVNEPFPIDLNENYVMIEDGDFISEFDYKHDIHDWILTGYFHLPDTPGFLSYQIPADRICPYVKRSVKLFISQPFTGYDDNEIAKQRKLLHRLYAKYIGRPMEEVVLLEQHLPEDDYDKPCNFESEEQHQFYYFCRSVGIMSKADVVLFYGDWYKSKGASLEHSIVMSYNMKHIEQEELIEYCKQHPELDDEFFMPLWKKQFFDMHELADVLISRYDKQFKAIAKLNNGFCEGYGDSPNEAYMNLYSCMEEKVHDVVKSQIDSLKDGSVTVAICDDAETVTDEDLINMHKDYISARDKVAKQTKDIKK